METSAGFQVLRACWVISRTSPRLPPATSLPSQPHWQSFVCCEVFEFLCNLLWKDSSTKLSFCVFPFPQPVNQKLVTISFFVIFFLTCIDDTGCPVELKETFENRTISLLEASVPCPAGRPESAEPLQPGDSVHPDTSVWTGTQSGELRPCAWPVSPAAPATSLLLRTGGSREFCQPVLLLLPKSTITPHFSVFCLKRHIWPNGRHSAPLTLHTPPRP